MRSLRTWEGPCALARGLLACVLRSENLHHRHARACRTIRETMMMRSVSSTIPPGGPRNSIELRFGTGVHPSESTSRNSIEKAHQDGGRVKSPTRRSRRTGGSLTRGFFSANWIFRRSREGVSRNSLDISMAVVGPVGASSVFIFSRAVTAGGRSKVWGLFIPDRRLATRIFPQISGNFFLEPGTVIRARKNCREIQGGGVGHG